MEIIYNPAKEIPARRGNRLILGSVISPGSNVVTEELTEHPVFIKLQEVGAITIKGKDAPPVKEKAPKATTRRARATKKTAPAKPVEDGPGSILDALDEEE